jgi:hypothetical protein
LVLVAVGLLAVAVIAASATPAFAYGRANWQVTFNGTATIPGGGGFGFWGWCDFGGGVTSGNTGDCELAQYLHPGFTCHVSIDISSWDGSGGTFVASGTATANPAAVADECLAFFPGAANFADTDFGIPSASGQYHLGVGSFRIPGAVGEFNMTVTQVR